MDSPSISRYKFYGLDEQNVSWRNNVDSTKILAKMFREITHMKPPRGRSGRHLDQTKHYAVELTSEPGRSAPFGANQGIYEADKEIELIENRRSTYRAYVQGLDGNAADIARLATWHRQHQSKLRVTNTVSGLQDLIQGLMGLGLRNVTYEMVGYREQKYEARMVLDNFIITIQERGGDD